jgi:hypothetical protein
MPPNTDRHMYCRLLELFPGRNADGQVVDHIEGNVGLSSHPGGISGFCLQGGIFEVFYQGSHDLGEMPCLSPMTVTLHDPHPDQRILLHT